MSRVLTSSQSDLLEANPYIVERLVEIQTPSASYYYTTGNLDVNVSTPTSGGTQTFYAANGIEIIGDISELYDLSINEITLQIGDVAGTIYNDMTRNANNYDFARTDVQIYLLFRNHLTFAPQTTDIINVYTGAITKIDSTRDANDFIINLRVSSNFARFDAVNGRNTSDYPQGLVTTGIVWGNVNG